MPLTASDVHNVAFSKPPIGKRGYNEDEVDAFLDLVEAELARLTAENNDLHNRIDQLNKRLRDTPAETGGGLRPVAVPRSVVLSPAGAAPDQHTQSAKVLGMAQEIADRLTNDARAEADRMLSQARSSAAQLLSEAQTKADGMISEARGRAQAMLHDARIRVEALERESREKAAALELDAARKHTETLGVISQEKIALEKRIAELSAFERDYRTRLHTYLSAQLRELDNRGATANPDTPRNHHSLTASESGSHRSAPEAPVLLRNTG